MGRTGSDLRVPTPEAIFGLQWQNGFKRHSDRFGLR